MLSLTYHHYLCGQQVRSTRRHWGEVQKSLPEFVDLPYALWLMVETPGTLRRQSITVDSSGPGILLKPIST